MTHSLDIETVAFPRRSRQLIAALNGKGDVAWADLTKALGCKSDVHPAQWLSSYVRRTNAHLKAYGYVIRPGAEVGTMSLYKINM